MLSLLPRPPVAVNALKSQLPEQLPQFTPIRYALLITETLVVDPVKTMSLKMTFSGCARRKMGITNLMVEPVPGVPKSIHIFRYRLGIGVYDSTVRITLCDEDTVFRIPSDRIAKRKIT